MPWIAFAVALLVMGCAQQPPLQTVAVVQPAEPAPVAVAAAPLPPAQPVPSAAPAPARPAAPRKAAARPAPPAIDPEPRSAPVVADPAPPQPEPVRIAQPAPPRERVETATKPAVPADPGKLVLVVIDGDTVDVNGARWRLQGFDAPEIDRAKCPEERERGLKAKARLQQILGAARVTTETLGRRDAYGRVLGTIRADGRDVGELLAAEKLAKRPGYEVLPWCGKDAPEVVAALPASRPAKAAPRKPATCKGLGKGLCGLASGCRWVEHTKARDKNGRELHDYCRKR